MLWKVRIARKAPSLGSLGLLYRMDMSQIVLNVTLDRIEPLETIARSPSQNLAKVRFTGQPTQRSSQFFASAIYQPSPGSVHGFAASDGIAHDRRCPASKGFDDAEAESLRCQ